MSVVALASMKGAPGVTTAAVALTATRASRASDGTALLIEADPSGGDLVARHGLRPDPGLVGLVTAARRGSEAADPWSQAQALRGGVSVVVAPASGAQARAVLRSGGELGGVLRSADIDVVVDCGRLAEDSPALPLVRAADVVALVSRGSLDAIQHLRDGVELLGDWALHPTVVLRGAGRYGPDEISSALGIPVAAHLPDDPAAAALLNGTSSRVGRRTLRTSALLRSIRALDETLADLVDSLPNPPEPPPAPGSAPGLVESELTS